MRFRSLFSQAVIASLVAATWMPASMAEAATTVTGDAFDTCEAPSLSEMSAWLNSSLSSMNIYIGGANQACGNGNLSSGWVSSVEALGWKLIPTYVGLQAPCVAQAGLATIDPAQATAEGASGADDAVARAKVLGLGPSTPIYFDMEGYGNDPACVNAAQGFLSAWSAELHANGYLAGVYGSSASTVASEAAVYNNPSSTHIDDIWFGNWNGTPNIYGDPFFPDSDWPSHHRLHQYLGGHNETHGGVTLNIDSDYTDGDVSGQIGASWSPWLPILAPPSGVQGAPAVASWAVDRLDVFARGGNNELEHMWSNGIGRVVYGWQDLGSPPGGMTSSPAAVSWGPNRIDVFVRGADLALWHDWWNGNSWVGWEGLGGILTSAPAVASQGPFSLDVFAVGTDHGLWHTNYDGSWHPFTTLGGYCLFDPAAVSWGAGRIDVFTVGAGSQLWHQWSDAGPWSGWRQEVAGQWASGPAAASWGPGRVDVFLASLSVGSPLAHNWYSAGWHSDSEGGVITAAPAAASWGPLRVDVFAHGTDNNIWHIWWGM
jgi:hypothetical protein